MSTETPGVPREAPAEPAEGAEVGPLVPQVGVKWRTVRSDLEAATPVFGTAQPLHGTSGRVRRWAYSIPEHRAGHWMLLFAADRVDVLEDRIGGAGARLFRAMGREDLARKATADPLPITAGALTGLLLTGWLLGRR